MSDLMKVISVDIRRVLNQPADAKTSMVVFQGIADEPEEGAAAGVTPNPVPNLNYPVTAQVAFNYYPGDIYDMNLNKVNN